MPSTLAVGGYARGNAASSGSLLLCDDLKVQRSRVVLLDMAIAWILAVVMSKLRMLNPLYWCLWELQWLGAGVSCVAWPLQYHCSLPITRTWNYAELSRVTRLFLSQMRSRVVRTVHVGATNR